MEQEIELKAGLIAPPPVVEVRVAGFRAVKEAQIRLEGITLVSGENGSGKSTISKFLYHVYDSINNYDEIAQKLLSRRVFRVLDAVARIRSVVNDILGVDEEDAMDLIERSRYRRRGIYGEARGFDVAEGDQLLLELEQLINDCKGLPEALVENRDIIRATEMMRFALRQTEQSLSLIDLLHIAKNDVGSFIQELKEILSKRPASLLKQALSRTEIGLPDKYSISEYGSLLVDSKDEEAYLKDVYFISKSIYIDTPMSVAPGRSSLFWRIDNGYLEKLHRLLATSSEDKSIEGDDKVVDLLELMRSEILFGEAFLDSSPGGSVEFKFKRDDQRVFDLSDVATGIKSFSVLQLLLKNGHLDDQTLLIIDEPEVHLHPQWVVEYARLLIRLNKYLGVKFFLTSHNPDFVSALRYIAEAEGVGERTNFYLAEEDRDEPNQFNYSWLGLNIDPIFESFNIALDRISQYGATE